MRGFIETPRANEQPPHVGKTCTTRSPSSSTYPSRQQRIRPCRLNHRRTPPRRRRVPRHWVSSCWLLRVKVSRALPPHAAVCPLGHSLSAPKGLHTLEGLAAVDVDLRP